MFRCSGQACAGALKRFDDECFGVGISIADATDITA